MFTAGLGQSVAHSWDLGPMYILYSTLLVQFIGCWLGLDPDIRQGYILTY